KKNADFRDREFIKSVRKTWSEKANMALEKYGHSSRIDERSYQEQGIDKEPRARLDRVIWQELKYLENQEKQLGQEITQVVQKVAQEKRYEENKAQGMGVFSAKFSATLNNNPLKSSIEPFSQKDDIKYKEQEKTSKKRKESVSQADFDMFIYKTIKNAERPKFEHERKIEEWEKSLKQLKSTYASYKGDLERVESEKWGMLGLYQSKEQKAEIERIKGVMGDLSKQFDRTKEYIAKEQDKIEQINKQNKPLYERKAQIMQDNPSLIEKTMAQLHQEQFKRNAEKWEREQKAKGHSRSISRDDGLSL
ncbi:MobA/MobL family protein, partial [Ursidibacter sp. B-7004-1]